MNRTHIQCRLILEGKEPCMPKQFKLDNTTYYVEGKSKNTNLIPKSVPAGVIFSGFTQQYTVKDSSGNKYEIYVYFYKKMEGQWCAVIDSMEDIQ